MGQQMKMVAVSLSDECVKEPRCSFCYASGKSRKADSFKVIMALHKYHGTTACFEYSGYGLGTLTEWHYGEQDWTMTTMPELVTETLCGAIKAWGVTALAISMDSEKATVSEWIGKAKIAKAAGLPVSCNYLIEQIPTAISPELLSATDQLNLLVKKPTGKLEQKQLDILELEIEQYKQLTKITTDACLGVQLGLTKDCGKGRDFIHLAPDGTKHECSFEDKCYLFQR
jgi:hypothetical protein